MRILEIKKINKKDKYQIKFDNKNIDVYSDIILKYNLLYKKEIDNDLYQSIIDDNKYYEAYNSALRYVSKKMCYEKEIYNYLNKFSLSKEENDKIINHLKDISILNDLNYIKAFIRDNLNLTPSGPSKIVKQLLDKGFDEDIILKEIKQIDEDIIINKIQKIIAKKYSQNYKYSNYQMKQKVLLAMLNLGYDRQLIQNELDKYNIDDNLLLEREYQKIYSKLKYKYSGFELKNKIKQKLYAKGFTIDQINNLLNDV